MRLSLTTLSLFALSVGVAPAQSVGINLTGSEYAPATASASRATNPRIWLRVSKDRIAIARTENEIQRTRSSPEPSSSIPNGFALTLAATCTPSRQG